MLVGTAIVGMVTATAPCASVGTSVVVDGDGSLVGRAWGVGAVSGGVVDVATIVAFGGGSVVVTGDSGANPAPELSTAVGETFGDGWLTTARFIFRF